MRDLLARVLPALAFVLAAAAMPPAAAQLPLEEGKQFIRIKNPQPTESGAKIEVIEFFSYGCPHCAHLEPELQKWLRKVPEDVQFRRVPVMFQPAWELLARDYYTLDALGIEPKLSPDVFKALHEQNVRLDRANVFFEWAAKQGGVDAKKVEEMYNSFAVVSKVNRAKQLAAAYKIEGVPTVIVDGKFMTGSDKIGGHPNMPAAIDTLVARARAERKK